MNLRLSISPEAVRDAMPPDRVLLDAACLLISVERAIEKAGRKLRGADKAALCATAAALTESQRAFFKNRRIAVSRDTATIPGAVITTWYRDGKLDTKGPAVVTNELKKIVGIEQQNPIQAIAEKWRTDYMSASNRAARAEARRAAIVSWAEEQRDKAVLPSTKVLWQSIIDKLNGDD